MFVLCKKSLTDRGTTVFREARSYKSGNDFFVQLRVPILRHCDDKTEAWRGTWQSRDSVTLQGHSGVMPCLQCLQLSSYFYTFTSAAKFNFDHDADAKKFQSKFNLNSEIINNQLIRDKMRFLVTLSRKW